MSTHYVTMHNALHHFLQFCLFIFSVSRTRKLLVSCLMSVWTPGRISATLRLESQPQCRCFSLNDVPVAHLSKALFCHRYNKSVFLFDRQSSSRCFHKASIRGDDTAGMEDIDTLVQFCLPGRAGLCSPVAMLGNSSPVEKNTER